jgi:hypothetical protein
LAALVRSKLPASADKTRDISLTFHLFRRPGRIYTFNQNECTRARIPTLCGLQCYMWQFGFPTGCARAPIRPRVACLPCVRQAAKAVAGGLLSEMKRQGRLHNIVIVANSAEVEERASGSSCT